MSARHDPVLHQNPKNQAENVEEKDSHEGEEQQKKPKLFSTSLDQAGLFMAVVAVTLRNPDTQKSLTCFAMLERCSDTDMVGQDVVDLLGLDVRVGQTNTNIYSITGPKAVPTKTTPVEVSDFLGEKINKKLRNVIVIGENYIETNRCPTTSDVSQWKHLSDVVTTDMVDIPRVMILILNKHSVFHRPKKIIK